MRPDDPGDVTLNSSSQFIGFVRRRAATALVLTAITSLGSAARATETKLDGLLRFESEDKKFAAQVGGRIQQDWAFIKADDDAETHFGAESIDGTEMRRARLFVGGKMFGNVLYKAEYDFVNSMPDYRDVFIELTGLPFGSVRVGNFYEQFCLEELTSDNYITFMERSAVDLFAPGRNPGIMAHSTFAGSRGTWALGVYRQDTSPGVSQENGAYSETARITFLPVEQSDGRRLVHIGIAVSHRRPPEKVRSYSLRPSAHLANNLVSTGGFAAERALLLGGEAAWVEGPLSIQAETALASHADPHFEDTNTLETDPTFMAFYVQGSYFFTGEHRPYKRSDGAFDRIDPNSNFGDGSGGLQLAARFSYGDLEDPDHGIAGGTLTDITFGANWYLNPHTRVMMNYVVGLPSRSDEAETGSSDRDGTVNVFQTRFAIDF
jgi:phosphate-selective porin OprO/OprP